MEAPVGKTRAQTRLLCPIRNPLVAARAIDSRMLTNMCALSAVMLVVWFEAWKIQLWPHPLQIYYDFPKTSVWLALAAQVIDANASRNPDPVAGIDGKAAQQGYARYQKSFSDPPPQPTFVIDAK